MEINITLCCSNTYTKMYSLTDCLLFLKLLLFLIFTSLPSKANKVSLCYFLVFIIMGEIENSESTAVWSILRKRESSQKLLYINSCFYSPTTWSYCPVSVWTTFTYYSFMSHRLPASWSGFPRNVNPPEHLIWIVEIFINMSVWWNKIASTQPNPLLPWYQNIPM